MKNILRSYLFIGFAVLLFFSAKEGPTKGQLIREEVTRKLEDYRIKQEAKCQKKVLERAGDLVDSTLIVRAKLQAKEIVSKPEIPFRPERPEVKLPKDTTSVLPILPDQEN